MSKKMKWDQTGERKFHTGVEQVALFPIQSTANPTGSYYTKGVAWNGITGVTETPEGADPTDLYADDTKYLTLRSAETLNLGITGYMYPDEWGECDGSADLIAGVKAYQQSRKTFGLAYKTLLGNDTEGNDHGYILHLVYGCTASPSERAYSTVNDSPEAVELSWDATTTPVDIVIEGKSYKKTSLITIDSTVVDKDKLKALEDVVYGSETKDPYLPMPAEVYSILAGNISG